MYKHTTMARGGQAARPDDTDPCKKKIFANLNHDFYPPGCEKEKKGRRTYEQAQTDI